MKGTGKGRGVAHHPRSDDSVGADRQRESETACDAKTDGAYPSARFHRGSFASSRSQSTTGLDPLAAKTANSALTHMRLSLPHQSPNSAAPPSFPNKLGNATRKPP